MGSFAQEFFMLLTLGIATWGIISTVLVTFTQAPFRISAAQWKKPSAFALIAVAFTLMTGIGMVLPA